MKYIAIFALVMLTFGIATAQIPHTISYQGYYTSNGQPVTGTYQMTFRLDTLQTGGGSIWSQGPQSVPITKGVYSVVLDVSTVAFNRQYWLETVINNVTSANRTQLTGVPYSLAPWTPSDSNVYFSGGNVGIGTNSPTARMDVRGNLTLDAGTSPVLFTGTASSELSRYLNLINSPTSPSASGLKAGGILVSDNYSYANPGKNDLIVGGNVGIGISSPDRSLTVQGLSTNSGGSGSFMNFKLGYTICCPPPVELLVGTDDEGGIISTISNNDLLLRAGGNSTNKTKMVIKSNSAAGIGVEATGGSLNVVGSGVPVNTGGGLRLGSANGSYNWIQSFGDLPLTINPLGNNVGIGTTTPSAPLEVIGRTKTGNLEITGGSDLAEPFDVESTTSPEAGTVVVINPDNPGKLAISTTAYDPKVAGVISGAGGIKPGLTLKQEGVADGNNLVAIAGRVYCKAEAFSSPIEPGDLLTTSSIAGFAMKAVNKDRSHGAVIGKAMSSLPSGKGLVLVLVNLQ